MLEFPALTQPIAVAVHFQDMHVVGQSIQDGTGKALGAEDFGPFIERQVRCDDDRAAFIALRDNVKQQLRAGFAQGNEAEFIRCPAAYACMRERE